MVHVVSGGSKYLVGCTEKNSGSTIPVSFFKLGLDTGIPGAIPWSYTNSTKYFILILLTYSEMGSHQCSDEMCWNLFTRWKFKLFCYFL
jgi:hypothetical protein